MIARRWGRRLFVAALAVAIFFVSGPGMGRVAAGAMAASFVIWAIVEWLLGASAWQQRARLRTAMGVAADLALISVVVASTGGGDSPWSMLYGLAILGAALDGGVRAPAATAVAAALAWLAVVYGTHTPPPPLAMLLQVSAWLLAGGVMAAIVRRRVSSERQAEQSARAHRRLQLLHANVLAAMREGVVLLDRDGRALDANAAAQRLLGPQWAATVERMIADAPPLIDALARRAPAETECGCAGRTLLVRIAPLPDSAGGAAAVLTLVDISRLRELERRLASEQRMAEIGRMAAMLAHEIRNPLQSLRQGASLLRAEDNDEVIAIIEEEIDRLSRLVRSMLDFARPLTPQPRPVRMRGLIEQALAGLPASARARLSIEVEDGECILDPDLLRVVIDNLLGNALRAGDGRVWLRWRRQGAGWRLEVEDECGGVPDAVRARLFEPFVSARADGIGLGLATVRRVCEAAGWRLALEDGPRGARFIVEADGERRQDRG